MIRRDEGEVLHGVGGHEQAGKERQRLDIPLKRPGLHMSRSGRSVFVVARHFAAGAFGFCPFLCSET